MKLEGEPRLLLEAAALGVIGALSARLFMWMLAVCDRLLLYGIAGYPMVDVRARYLMPSEYGDTLEIDSRIAEWGRSSFLVHHRLLKTGLLAAEVYERRVWVTRTSEVPARFKGQPIPQEVKDVFASHLSQR